MRYLYTILFYLILPFLFLRLLWRSRAIPEYRKRWAERLGYCPYKLGKSIWVHAVSVGETIAAVPLIKALAQAFPDLPIVVTNMTPTGAARVKAALQDSVKQVYIPYDVPTAVNRFLRCIKPCVAVVMETELWPNLFAGCRKQGVPIVIANARLSEKSARGYACIPNITQIIFSAVNKIAAQASADAERFIALGLDRNKVTVTGNLKFDLQLPVDLSDKSEVLQQHLGKDRFIWVAASTHPGEEDIILAAHHTILKKHPSALLILVPRHPDRFDEVADLVKQKGLSVARRSTKESCLPEMQVYLGDTMGELLLMYSVACVAFVAGSFAKVGGHNMLEPAVLQKPILTGPVLFNFAEISELLLKEKGMRIVNNANELAAQIGGFFEDHAACKLMGENAYRVVAANRGALQRQLELIISLVRN